MSEEKNRACPACKSNNHDSQDDHLFLMADKVRWYCGHTEYHANGKVYIEGEGIDAEESEVYKGEGQLEDLLKSASATGQVEPDVSGDTSRQSTGTLSFGSISPSDSVELPSGNTGPNVKGERVPYVPPPPGSVRHPITSTYRGISTVTFDKFRVTGTYTKEGKCWQMENDLYETDTNVVITQKIRQLPKTFTCAGKTGKGTLIQLFGQSVFFGAKKVLIVEGELDAMSAWQMFQDGKYTKGVAVLSLPLGANLKAVSDNMKYLKGSFKEITFCFDSDKAGQDASKLMATLLPSSKHMDISEKDANDMLTKGKEADFISAFFSAEIYKPDTIIRVSDVMDRVMLKPTMGEPWPWPTLTQKTYGRNPGQGIYVGAGVKIGKSEFINEIVNFDVQRGKRIAVLKYEEPPFMTVKRVAGKIDGTFYHKPDVNYSDVALKATALSMQDLLIMYPAFGSATWETTKDFIRYAAMMGCETIIIDPITKLTNTLTSSETETELRKLSDELACMAQDMGFFYIVTCHLKTPYSGPPHERGGKVQSSQFRGSRAMMENTYYMMGIERDKDPLLTLVEQNTSTFVLLEDRNFGNSASFSVLYDPINQSYLEPSVTLKF